MNKIARSVLALYSYDDKAEVMTLENELRQAISLVARTPMIVAHAYAAKRCYFDHDSLYLHRAQDGLSLAEKLPLLRPERQPLHRQRGQAAGSVPGAPRRARRRQQQRLHLPGDLLLPHRLLLLHLRGGGLLKGPRHGGANIKANQMLNLIRDTVKDWKDDDEVSSVLRKIIHKEIGDGSGLIYGMGHAIYTMSDPRAVILKKFCPEAGPGEGHDRPAGSDRVGGTAHPPGLCPGDRPRKDALRQRGPVLPASSIRC